MNCKHLIAFIIIATVVASCNNTKYLGANQNLFVGSTSKIKSTDKLSSSNRKGLESEMQALVRPKPNSTILGARFKLSVYNRVKEPKKQTGLKHWLKYKVGEPPVLASNSLLEKNRQIIQNHLDNKGFFRDSVMIDTSIKDKKLSVTYTALLDTQYTIRNVTYPHDSSILAKRIQKRAVINRPVLLKKNNPYDLDIIKAERTRIDARIKDFGFYYFNADDLVANVDSTLGNHKVDIDVKVKPETPKDARLPYRIDKIYVFADYDIHSDTSVRNATHYGNYNIIDPHQKFNPAIFKRTLVFKRGDLYNRTDHNLSLNRLISLGVFKFVKVRFEPSSDSVQKLNVYYYLTPTNKKSIRFQVSALSKGNNGNGGQFSINWRNRSLFKGAELFTVSANLGVEKQISSAFNSTTLTYGAEANMYVPRIIAPFHLNTSSAYVPQTKFSIAYNFFDRTSLYVLKSLTGSYGYVWKNSIKNEYQLTLLNINLVKPGRFTDTFQRAIDTNLALRRSVEKQFILGSIYNYNYNTLARVNNRPNNFYFNGNIDVSGNVLGLLTDASLKKGKQKEILGNPFTQYIRLEGDARYYRKLGNQFRSINFRLDAGMGIAYGNDTLMPFIKEFFAGGASDLRGFRARTLGPGTHYAGNPRTQIVFDQPGDVKLLMTAEYRAKLFSIVRYALFTDAGNIWTLRNFDSIPGSQFTSKFLSQLGVDAGVGLRFDISLLVLRLDVAFPLTVPYTLPDGKYTVDFGNKDWRRNNLIFNLAIGYPF